MSDAAFSRHQVYLGDARRLRPLADASVELVVTSPPYWQLKDYGSERQVGFFDNYETYIDHLNLVWQECARVLKPGCRLCINIGDQFARAEIYGRYKVIPIRTEIIRFCERLGLDYLGAIIWQKTTTCNTSGGGAVMGSFPYPRNGVLRIDYEFILLFRQPGATPPPTPEAKAAAALSRDEWVAYFAGHWQFRGERQKTRLAPFPVELPKRLIRMFTFPGETVLDPFAGTGTTALAARNQGRHSVSFEIDPDAREVIADRLGLTGQAELGLAGHAPPAEVTFTDLPPLTDDELAEALAKLPWRCEAPTALQPKQDPRARNYGSKVTRQARPREDYRRVRQVPAPDRVVLDDGHTVRLVGIVPRPEHEAAARAFIEEMTRGQRVFVRREAPQLEKESRELATEGEQWGYLLLANRTMVNARLLRAGLAAPDRQSQYRNRRRFERYAEEAARAAEGN